MGYVFVTKRATIIPSMSREIETGRGREEDENLHILHHIQSPVALLAFPVQLETAALQ